ncbi:MAG: alkaline phosphatase family protein [Nocardioides sp.]
MSIVRSITPTLSSVALVAALLAASPSATAGPSEPAPADLPLGRGNGDPQVLAISIDALNPEALRKLGRRGAPHLWRLVDEGASTLQARTQLELTVTLPNHTSMVTGRRIDASEGGHGVTWNDDLPQRPPTVQAAAGHPVGSLFTVAHQADISTALFATKAKFALFQRSWPQALDRVAIKEEQDAAVVRAVRRDLRQDRGITFLHLGLADQIGHARGFMSRAYVRAVHRIDGMIGTILAAADGRRALDDLTIILTSDHGGLKGTGSHSKADAVANYRVPFAVWGPGISAGDLNDFNPGYRNPRRARPDLRGKQPVRNGDVANVALGLLGLRPVRGSIFGVERPLRLRR